jgi:[protein-PII] uridylyltransferase
MRMPNPSDQIGDLAQLANERLARLPVVTERAEQIEAFRRFLRLETERLRMRHRSGLGGDEIAAGRSHQVDLVVRRVCQLVAEEFGAAEQSELASTALVALGGYGRGELAPFSDVDVLFLYPGRPSRAVKEFVERVLAMLWDTGFTVGHSFRSVDECLAIARDDLHSRTAMAESRPLVGDAALMATLERRLHEAVFQSKSETQRFLTALAAETELRYSKHGRSVGLLEPNVKESAGGLRDLHTVLWLGHALYGCHRLEDLRERGEISDGDYVQARRAQAFLARVRNEAHFCAGRKADLLTLDLQPDVAAHLGYAPARGMEASERFMRDYYQRAHDLHHVFESFAVRHGLFERKRGLRWRLTLRRATGRFEVHDGRVHLRRGAPGFEGDPQAMLTAFELAQAQGAELADDLKLAVRSDLAAVDTRFRASREASRAFVGLLGRRGSVAAALRAMHDTGFLGRYLPEFARITFLVQHDQYHRYTVDEHTLRTIEALDEVAVSKDAALTPFRHVLDEVEDAVPLYLGLVLHDVGKGRGESHVAAGTRIAEKVCARLHLSETVAQDVVFLVRQHLVMSQVSQRRDLSEARLIDSFAGSVGSLRRLNLLFLLTYADHCGVGPGIWNEWKAALLWELYRQARAHLTGKAEARWDTDRRLRAKLRVMEELGSAFPLSAVERHLAMLPEKYLRATKPAQVGEHLRLVTRLETAPLAAHWRDDKNGHFTELTVGTRDATGLFARLAGTMSVHGLNILGADLYTREDGIVLDRFQISEAVTGRAVDEERWRRIEADLAAAVDGRLDVPQAVSAWQGRTRPKRRPPRRRVPLTVRFDDLASPTATVVEIGAEDTLGLAYRIASTLAALGLNITFAKVASDKSRAWDVFYVTDAAGRKLQEARMQEVEQALSQALSASE